MNKQLITITTDLGDGFATSQLRAVVTSLGFGGQLAVNLGSAKERFGLKLGQVISQDLC